MLKSQNARRARTIEGTQVLWSTVTYVPVILCGILFLSLIDPLVSPFEQDDTPLRGVGLFLFVLFVVIATPLTLRALVWRPIKLLADDCGDAALFRAHCRRILRLALPFVPLMALPMSLLCLNLGSWFILAQVALILAADHLIEKWRQGPIVESVDDLLAH